MRQQPKQNRNADDDEEQVKHGDTSHSSEPWVSAPLR
jgi:hypothetical protein